MPLFRSSPKSPQELVKGLRDALHILSSGAKKADKAAEEAAKLLGQIKVIRCVHCCVAGYRGLDLFLVSVTIFSSYYIHVPPVCTLWFGLLSSLSCVSIFSNLRSSLLYVTIFSNSPPPWFPR